MNESKKQIKLYREGNTIFERRAHKEKKDVPICSGQRPAGSESTQ